MSTPIHMKVYPPFSFKISFWIYLAAQKEIVVPTGISILNRNIFQFLRLFIQFLIYLLEYVLLKFLQILNKKLTQRIFIFIQSAKHSPEFEMIYLHKHFYKIEIFEVLAFFITIFLKSFIKGSTSSQVLIHEWLLGLLSLLWLLKLL